MSKAILILLGFLLISSSVLALSLDTVSYPSDKKADLYSAGNKIATAELTNPTNKAGSELWLKDCGIYSCSLFVKFTPVNDFDLSKYSEMEGKASGGTATSKGVKIWKNSTKTVSEPIYSVKESFYEEVDNKTSITEKIYYNETYISGYKDVVKDTSGYVDLKNEVLSGGKAYLLRFDYSREKNIAVDLIPKIGGAYLNSWAWWNSTTAEYDYWYNNLTNEVWGEFNITNGTIGLYAYGNCTKVSESNGTAVFDYFATSTTGWTSTKTGGSGTCVFTYDSAINGFNYSVASGETTCIARYDTSGWDNITTDCDYSITSGTTAGGLIAKYVDDNNFLFTDIYSNTHRFYKMITGSATALATANSFTTVAGQFYPYEIKGTDTSQYTILNKTSQLSASQSILGTGSKTGIRFYTTAGGGKVQFANYRVRTYSATEPTIAYGDIETGSFSDGQGATCGYRVEINITNTQDVNNYEVGLNYTKLGSNSNLTLTPYYLSATAPTLQSISLYPATIYKNTTVSGAVNWTHPTNTTLPNVYMGLAINGTIISSFNQTYSNYTNATIWNYTAFNVSAYTHGDNVSLWSWASSTDTNSSINYSANITIGNLAPEITNIAITNPLMETENATGSADFSDVESDVINCRWEWFLNGTALLNISQSPCLNSSVLTTGNFSGGDYINFTVYANDSLGANSTPGYSGTVLVGAEFNVNSYNYGGATHYEGVLYNYDINFSTAIGNNATVIFNYFGTNLTPSCSNVSNVFYCTYNGLIEPATAINATARTGYWFVDINNGTNITTYNQTFTDTAYWGVWITNISSSEQITMRTYGTITVNYANVSGFSSALTGTVYLGSNLAYLTCSGGTCSASILAQDVNTSTIFRTEGNLTIVSSFWLTAVDREIAVYNSFGKYQDATSNSGTISNPTNAHDQSWTTYADFGANAIMYFNYTNYAMLNVSEYKAKDFNATHTITTFPEDCWGTNISIKVDRSTIYYLNYSCYNYTSSSYSQFARYYATSEWFYEQNASVLTQNNSLTRIVPFGLNNCTTGTPIMYFNVQDENTYAYIVSNYTQIFFLTVGGNTTGYSFSGTASNWSICIYPATLTTATYTSYETYVNNPTYPVRAYVILNGSTASAVNYTRYLGSGAVSYTFNIMNQYASALEGAYVEITKFNTITGSWETISNTETDYTGSTAFNLVPYTLYRVSISKAGYTALAFDFTPTTIYNIDIYMASTTTAVSTMLGAEWVLNDTVISFTPNNQSFFVNNTNITFAIANSNNALEYFGMEVVKDFNRTKTIVYSVNSTNASGGILIYTTNGTGYYTAKAWWKRANYSLYDPSLNLFVGNNTGIASAITLFSTLMSPFAFYLLAILITACVVGFVSQYAGDGAGLVGLIVLWGFTLLNPSVDLVCLVGVSGCITPLIATSLTTVLVIAGFYVKQYV